MKFPEAVELKMATADAIQQYNLPPSSPLNPPLPHPPTVPATRQNETHNDAVAGSLLQLSTRRLNQTQGLLLDGDAPKAHALLRHRARHHSRGVLYGESRAQPLRHL